MKKYIEHVIEEGSRVHVISYLGVVYDGEMHGVEQCNVPNCEINQEYDKLVKSGIL